MRRGLAAGNWKMNGTAADLAEVETIAARLPDGPEILICPPATLIERMARIAGQIAVGGQDCHAAANGAHTGDVSAAMLKDAGASHVILGHSERRGDHGETDAMVGDKARAALAEGLIVVLCVGETEAERRGNRALDVVGAQLDGSIPDGVTAETLVIAYEPVWAIGTGKVPTTDEIAEVHGFIRQELSARFGVDTGAAIRILYGGSVKAANAAGIFAVPTSTARWSAAPA